MSISVFNQSSCLHTLITRTQTTVTSEPADITAASNSWTGMHRTIEITVPAEVSDRLVQDLKNLDSVLGLTVQRGASIKPPGDVITVQTLNTGADDVMRRAAEVKPDSDLLVVTAEADSINAPGAQAKVVHDVDEQLWEEMETDLRSRGRLTANFTALMALGGAIAAAALVSEPMSRVLGVIAASIIAPSFEPAVAIPLGIVIRKWRVVRLATQSFVVGMAILAVAAALTFWILHVLGTGSADALQTEAVRAILHPNATGILMSVCASAAGVLITTTYQNNVLAGPIIALVLVPSAAIIGMAAAAGDFHSVLSAVRRLGFDSCFIVVLGIGIMGIKQHFAHQHRKPIA